MPFYRSAMATFVAASCLAGVASANIAFNITYTAAVQGNPNFANIQSAVNYVSNEYSSRFSDNITLNFTVDQNSSGLGSSLFSNNYWRGSYATLRTAMVADGKSPNDATATAPANLPATEPYAGGSTGWYATSAQAKALGLITNQSVFDGTYTFNASQTYTYNPASRGTGGFDFIGVTEHEFAELMGRTTQITNTGFGYNILDTMRFTQAGTRNITPSTSGVYFSYDNGNTHLAVYNAGPPGDMQDFDGTVATDPYNASTGPNQAHLLNSVDDQNMDVIGYDLVPAPGAAGLLAPLGLLAARRRRR